MESLFDAIEIVRNRQAQIVRALSAAELPFALSGSNATFAWIASIDEAACRQYRNVEFVLKREGLEPAIEALSPLGLQSEIEASRVLFRNRTTRRDRWTDLAIFAGESLAKSSYAAPTLDNIRWLAACPVIGFDELVSFQLSRWRLDDKVDLRDLIDVGLLDRNFSDKLQPELALRLEELLDDPDG